MSFLPVLNQTLVLFILIFIGFIIKKKNIITNQMIKDLSGLILNVTLPLMMITAMLADIKITEVLGNKKLYILAFIRLLIAPLSMVLIFSVINVPSIVKGVLVTLTGMPSAVNTAIFATKYNADSKLASQGIFITTLLNILTAPLIIYLLTI
ncbi:hypothetical protein DW1_0260 [Proteiniborus sp. DW1]|uniref:AEC family transporter n=1 Tax=Proteiniborus sp. DW1 TaxID=1889883 RepID=UPI00092E16D8|nr:AEC family transporter [Proteiniborus sp. DW1]SCG81881.1 hypothetical protein DW1_0260 [Proteiniborus sp. DW1]